MIAEQENKFWKDCEKGYSSIQLMKKTFEWINLNEIEHSKHFQNIECQKYAKVYLHVHILFQCQIIYSSKPIWACAFTCVITLQWVVLWNCPACSLVYSFIHLFP